VSDVVINAEGVGKSFRLEHRRGARYVALRDVLAEKARALGGWLRGRERDLSVGEEEFWALRDVSFEVRRAEVLGIIGRNGAGKSTLLKILSRITEPTEGRVRIRGRVASLLEVGTGFHPELTGRENIFVNGTILGMTRAEVKRKFDEIVAFAEVEKFLDTPVKRYSSGMYVRLAFAVAAHLDPDILIVDEVLAVGDAEFQRKCLGKMKNVASSGKRTVLFVSHNMAAVRALCGNAILLQNGSVAMADDVGAVIDTYSKSMSNGARAGVGGNRRLSETLNLDSLEFSPNPVESGTASGFKIRISSFVSLQIKELAILIYSVRGDRVAILDLRSGDIDWRLTATKSLTITGHIRAVSLVEGEYSIGLYVNCGDLIGNVYDLAILTVAGAAASAAHSPYPAHDRGVVELSYDFAAT
jgi:ABC-type polysaccharide/polyol phosphate transport system ATPase subunit